MNILIRKRMKISDLKPNMDSVDVEVEVVEKGEEREFIKFGRIGKMANALVRDETGEIVLTLWNEEVEIIPAGAKIKVVNGRVSEFQDKLCLSSGRYGCLFLM